MSETFAQYTLGAYVPVSCGVDPACVLRVVVVTQSSPLGWPSPSPSQSEPGTLLPPTDASVTLTVPFCSTVKE